MAICANNYPSVPLPGYRFLGENRPENAIREVPSSVLGPKSIYTQIHSIYSLSPVNRVWGRLYLLASLPFMQSGTWRYTLPSSSGLCYIPPLGTMLSNLKSL